MNIKGIVDLSEQLKGLGFSDLLHPLVKRICFKPKRFLINYHVERGGNVLRCQLYFEGSEKDASGYLFTYYDAFFQPAQSYSETIGGVDVSLLVKKMSEINWRQAFDFSERRSGVDVDKETFDEELKVAAVVESLAMLHSFADGVATAISLKQKFWFGISGQDGTIMTDTAIKGKLEVSQRFYVIEGQPSISVDEAYRYLQNRWLEREMLAKRKQIESPSDNGNEASGYGTGLLKKRRRRGTASSKSKK